MDNSKFYLVVAGSRSFVDYELMESKLNHFLVNVSKPVVIIHGGARGADTLAGRYASEHKLECKVFPADWDSHGKSAGYVRNRRMHAYIANASDRGCVCFWDGKSRGTAHNFKLAEEFSNPLRIVRFDKEESKGSSSRIFHHPNGVYDSKDRLIAFENKTASEWCAYFKTSIDNWNLFYPTLISASAMKPRWRDSLVKSCIANIGEPLD